MVHAEEDFDFEWEERKDDTPFKVHMVAGSIAGISEHVLLLPFDNMKTHLQTKSTNLHSAFREIKASGIKNFYRGSGIIAFGCVPSHALYFFNYEFLKARIIDHSKIDVFGGMLVGGLSTVFHDLVMTPCDMIKQRSQLLNNQSTYYIINQAYRKEGLRAFWRSFPVNFVSNLPSSMILVSANENLKKIMQRYVNELHMKHYFFCAAVSGIISALFTTPLDNIKTRLNVQQHFLEHLHKLKENMNKTKKVTLQQFISENLFSKQPVLKREFSNNNVDIPNCKCNPFTSQPSSNELIKYPNALCAMKIINKEEGFRGFFKGLSMRMMDRSLSAAVSWCFYEFGKKHLIKSKMLQ